MKKSKIRVREHIRKGRPVKAHTRVGMSGLRTYLWELDDPCAEGTNPKPGEGSFGKLLDDSGAKSLRELQEDVVLLVPGGNWFSPIVAVRVNHARRLVTVTIESSYVSGYLNDGD